MLMSKKLKQIIIIITIIIIIFIIIIIIVIIYSFFSFAYRLHFSGVHGGSSEFVDISDLTDQYLKFLVRGVFVRSGFANKTMDDKLGPCPLGTFVDSSSADPSCQQCPAGKL